MSNDTVTAPNENGSDPDGTGFWFPLAGAAGWRLDVVTLLAVIGESSIGEHSQAITASSLCLLPRIVPAPQALLKPSRPSRMPETNAKMTGVYSGVVLDSVGFFANIIHPLDELKPFAFRVLRITHRDRNEAGGMVVPSAPARANSGLRGLIPRRRSTAGSNKEEPRSPQRIPGPPTDAENGTETENGNTRASTVHFSADVEAGEPPQGLVRRRTAKEKFTDVLTNPTLAQRKERPAVPPKLFSPVHIITVVSFFITMAIIATAAYWQDGNALVATVLLSIASSITGIASWWKPILMNRSHTNKVPQADIMIRTREGAFLLIKCTEEVSRELYSSLEECNYYVDGRIYRLLMGVGTVILMVSVILLGNCYFNSQIFIGASYIVLNGFYWAMGMLPKSLFWDLSRYEVEDITPKDSQHADENNDPNDEREGYKSYTRTLWYAIRETKVTGWVERGGAAPSTAQWKRWLEEAEKEARAGNRAWPAVGRKDDIMREDVLETGRETDKAEQSAPATYVQNNVTPQQNPSF